MSSLSLPAGFDLGPVRPIPFDEFRGRILDLYRPPLRARNTHQKMRQVLDLVGGLGGVETTADLSLSTVGRFVESRGACGEHPNTTFSHLSYLRAACKLAVGMRCLHVSPFAVRDRWVRRVKPAGKRHHSIAEIGAVLELMRSDIRERRGWARWRARRLYALAATVAYTGLRKNEALYLRAEDLELSERMILVRPRVGGRLKTEASEQPVPMPLALVGILEDWLSHRLDAPESAPCPADCPWVIPNVGRTGPWINGHPGHKPVDRLKALGERAGVEGFTFQSLRHSWATHAESAWGLTEAQIQRVLRHTTPHTAREHYRHADAENLRRLGERIDLPGSDAGPV